MKSLFTSESVTCGHPDKLCDRVADTILDEVLRKDAGAHVACEVMATAGKLHIAGEITSKVFVDYEAIARSVVADIGYTEPTIGFDADSAEITVDIHEQSPDIARGVNRSDKLNAGAGDQGMVTGYACNETMSLMPFPITYAHRLAKRLEFVRRSGELPHLRPDGKTQVTVEYEDGVPKRFATVVVSAQHRVGISVSQIREDVLEHVIQPVLPADMLDNRTEIFVNPVGWFVIGGPAGDTGLTGRKLMVDAYGGYAIGLAEPLSLRIDDFGTGSIPVQRLADYIMDHVDMRPEAIIRRFKLRRPIYSGISCYGHFGENAKGLPWEQIDLAEQMKVWAQSY